jgi:hypothetical protein
MAVGATVGVGLTVADGEGLALGDGLGTGVGVAVGGAVGATVGGTVGGGVGRGVEGGGVGVGAAVAAAWTVMVPCIVGWIEQWYANVPAAANEIVLLLAPGAIGPVSNRPEVSDVAVCVVPSTRFCHVTVSPTLIVAGAKLKFWIATVRLAASAAAASETLSASTAIATRPAVLRAIR